MGQENFKSYNLEITEGENEKVIKNEEFRALNPEEISSQIYKIFEKIQHDRLGFADKEDKFIIRDYISIVNNLSVDSGGPHELGFNLEVEGLVEELKFKYHNALNDNFKKLNLESGQLYAIYNWDHEFNIFDKKEVEINNETLFKGSYDGKLVVDGKANK